MRVAAHFILNGAKREGLPLESPRAEASECFSSKEASQSNSRARRECNSSQAAWSAKLTSRWPQFNNKFRTRTVAGVEVQRSRPIGQQQQPYVRRSRTTCAPVCRFWRSLTLSVRGVARISGPPSSWTLVKAGEEARGPADAGQVGGD